MSAKIIAIANNKGGIGKTTTAINLADTLRLCKYKTLLIDMDPQCNSSETFNGNYTTTIYDVLVNEENAEKAITKTDLGDIIPGDRRLASAAIQLTMDNANNAKKLYNLLSNAIKNIKKNYDFIVIDTPPDLGIYMTNSLMASDGVVVPIGAQTYSVNGLNNMISVIEGLKNNGKKVNLYGILITDWDVRRSSEKSLVDGFNSVAEAKKLKIFTPIRRCSVIPDAQLYKKSIFVQDKRSNAVKDYVQFTKELITEINKYGN